MGSIRKRVAGLVLLVGALLLGARMVSLGERQVDVRITYRIGGGPAVARSLEAAVRRPGAEAETIAIYRVEEIVSDPTQRVRLPKGRYHVEILLRGEGGRARRVTRTIDVAGDAAITVDLRDEAP